MEKAKRWLGTRCYGTEKCCTIRVDLAPLFTFALIVCYNTHDVGANGGDVGMEYMQYTVRGVPAYVDTELRDYAVRKAQSLNQALVDLITTGLGLFKSRPKNQDVMALVGSWQEDPEAEKALEDMRVIDEDLWR